MKALQVSIDGAVIGVFVPPDGCPFAAMVGNIASITCGPYHVRYWCRELAVAAT